MYYGTFGYNVIAGIEFISSFGMFCIYSTAYECRLLAVRLALALIDCVDCTHILARCASSWSSIVYDDLADCPGSVFLVVRANPL
jgi:hypothetical protein